MLKHVDGWVSAIQVPEIMEFCLSRGLTKDDVIEYELGTNVDEDSIHYNRLMFPLRQFGFGELVGYQSRTVPALEVERERPLPKYFHDVRDKSKHWFGLDKDIRTTNAFKRVVVTSEGPLDVFPIHKLGYDAGAYMGSSISEHQAAILRGLTDVVIHLVDGDAAGISGLELNAMRTYSMGLTTYVAVSPSGEDPSSMTTDALRSCIKGAIRYEDSEWFNREV